MIKKQNKDTAGESGIFVYIGPSIRGVIQSGTIYRGTRDRVCEKLKAVIDKYPKIERLIIEDIELKAAREKIKNGSNSLSLAYKSLLAK